MREFYATMNLELASRLARLYMMPTTSLKGKVLTVLGAKSPEELGVILPHEQPLVDLTGLFMEVPARYSGARDPKNIASFDFQLENIAKIRQFPYGVKANLVVDDIAEVISELKLFKQAGGGTLCDISPFGVRLKREELPRISRETGLHIIAGTAFYVDPLIPEEVKLMTIEERSEFLIGEIMDGIGGSGVRCGLIGELGCSSPLTDNEKKSLQAAAIAQQRTGAPLMIHPGIGEEAPLEILDILETAGADVSHTVIAHMDRTVFKNENVLRLARRGCYIEYDLFGTECSHYQFFADKDFPSDAQKIQKIKFLLNNGFADKVLISQDIHTKHRMACYGGHGYTHILEHVAPKMEERGIPKEIVTQLTTKNPQTWLTFR